MTPFLLLVLLAICPVTDPCEVSSFGGLSWQPSDSAVAYIACVGGAFMEELEDGTIIAVTESCVHVGGALTAPWSAFRPRPQGSIVPTWVYAWNSAGWSPRSERLYVTWPFASFERQSLHERKLY